MNNLKVAIIEDEVPAARLLHSMLKRLRPQWEIVVLPGNIEEAVAWFDANPHPELLFLDIHLSDGNSFDFLSLSHPSSLFLRRLTISMLSGLSVSTVSIICSNR